jgi:DNA-binding NtrC family response regulator
MTRSWPGNIRELANAVERAVILSRDGRLGPERFLAPVESVPAPAPVDGVDAPATFNLRELERVTIDRALKATGGHRTRAAQLLGISERTLRNKLNVPADKGSGSVTSDS